MAEPVAAARCEVISKTETIQERPVESRGSKVNYAISFQWEDKLIGLIVGEILDFKEIIALPNPDSVSSTSSKCKARKGDRIPSRFNFCRLDLRPVTGKELQ